jgi:hypothetical protein
MQMNADNSKPSFAVACTAIRDLHRRFTVLNSFNRVYLRLSATYTESAIRKLD